MCEPFAADTKYATDYITRILCTSLSIYVLYIYTFLHLRQNMSANIYIPKFSSRMLQKNTAIGLNFT